MSLLSSPGGMVAVFPGGGAGVYGPTGFTRRPGVAAILAPYELDDPDGDVVAFDGLPHYAAAQLLSVLPLNQGEVAAANGPSFRELLELTASCPSARFSGYRVSPRRFDERVALDGFVVHAKDVTDALRIRLHHRGPCLQVETGFELAVRWS